MSRQETPNSVFEVQRRAAESLEIGSREVMVVMKVEIVVMVMVMVMVSGGDGGGW